MKIRIQRHAGEAEVESHLRDMIEPGEEAEIQGDRLIERVRTNVPQHIEAFSPYHPDLPARAKRLGGVWNPVSKAWVFDVRDEDRVRALYREIFGTDDSENEKTVDVRLTFPEGYSAKCNGIYFFGRCLARAKSKRGGATLGEKVVVLEGGAGSGGSAKYWTTQFSPGTVIEVRDVPKSLVDQEMKTASEDRKYFLEVIDEEKQYARNP